VASKGNRAFVIDYTSGTGAAVLLVATMAQQQFSRL
jgi:hypothetical protein